MFVFYLILINILAFILMGADKYLAIKRRYRISENRLLFLPLVGGATGSYLALLVFKHKTKHFKFKYGLPILIIINLMQIYLLKGY
ncbi:MAG: DUF1294 domain-containing protein [Bacillota bacterium]